MTETETELDIKFNGIDVESILARVEKRGPLMFSRKRTLYQAPEFIQRLPAEETVQEGTTVTFGCKIAGFPKPDITWYKDDDVIGCEARARKDSDDTNGIHCLKLQEVSKCDVGTYKVHASNLEGSSASSLYLSVKAKSKNRNRKKKKTRTVACAPLFPAIVEHEAEERRETLAVERQPDSPLTPIYSNIARRSPVSWPTFLGEWAYNMDDVTSQDDVDLEIGSEDVFDNEPDDTMQVTVTFVGVDEMNIVTPDVKSNGDIYCDTGRTCMNNSKETHGKDMDKNPLHFRSKRLVHSEIGADIDSLPCVEKENANNIRIVNEKYNQCENCNNITNNAFETNETKTNRANSHSAVETGENGVFTNQFPISKIVVNRSYATGDSTFSVATRREIKPVVDTTSTRLDLKHDSLLKENTIKNENITRHCPRNLLSCDLTSCDKHFSETIFLVCAFTFLALCLDLQPAIFIIGIVVLTVVRTAYGLLLKNR